MNDSKNQLTQWLTTGVLVIGAFVIGMLFTEVRMLRKGGVTAGAGTGNTADIQQPAQPTADYTAIRPVDDTDHIRGNKDAAVTLIEYSDFECPFCGQFKPTVDQVMEEFGDDVRLVYRHFPLESIHPNARPAAVASECVAELKGEEAFWSYHDVLFEATAAQTELDEDFLLKSATDLGVNGAQFTACVESGRYDQLVDDHTADGSAAGVQGTPGTFVLHGDSGEFINGALPFASIKNIINGYLN